MGIVRPWEGRGKGNPAALFAQNICGAFKWHAQTKPQLHTHVSSWGPAPFHFHQAPRPPSEAVSVQDEESCPVHQDLCPTGAAGQVRRAPRRSFGDCKAAKMPAGDPAAAARKP